MSANRYDTAIVGMAARVPGAADVDSFWRNTCGGIESLERLELEQMRARGASEKALSDPLYVPVSATADGLDEFEPELFGFTQREAEICDPQFRLFIELCHTALEHAGYDPARIDRRVGVFGGTTANTYREDYVEKNRTIRRSAGAMSVRVGNNPDYVAPMVSYRLGFTGPSVSLYTACSTSLVAVHEAIHALDRGECVTALAGGVQIDLPLGGGYQYREGSIFARDGHVRPFAADATGTIFSNGGAVVVLKRLADAIADDDEIYAVIRASAVNNDGGARAGFTAPGTEGQTELIRAALRVGRTDPRTIGLVEAHGTGTVVGDPIEVSALTRAYRDHTAAEGFCWLGSIKGNVGHLGPAAGTAGLIKAALAVREGVIPPSINCAEPNPALELVTSPFRLADKLLPWGAQDGPRRAAVSSFGIGGTNAHLIIEQPPARAGRPTDDAGRPHLLPLAARTREAVAAVAAELADHLERGGVDLADAAFTLQQGRTARSRRRFVVACESAEAVAELRQEPRQPAPEKAATGVAFLFPGQGVQYPGMGAQLYRRNAAYRDAVDRCSAHLQPLLGVDLRELLHADAADPDAAAELSETAITQPALFVVEWALAQVWASIGVRPAAMLGHSLGELVAATVAGVFTVEDALSVAAARGALMQSMPRGAMLALPAGYDAVADMLPDDVELAAVNSSSTCVVSGAPEAVDRLAAEFADIGIGGTRLRTSHAFHSRAMEPILAKFAEAVAGVDRRPPQLPFLSNLTGDWITDDEAVSPHYWSAQLRHAVRFADGVGRLRESGERTFVEVGPGHTLCSFVRQHAAEAGAGAVTVSSLRPARGAGDDEAVLLAAVGTVWTHGADVDFTALRTGGRRTALPTYPYQRRRCWVDPDRIRADHIDEAEVSRDPLQTPFYVPVWRQSPMIVGHGDHAGETWLVAVDGDERGEALLRAAQDTGAYVIAARAGVAFSQGFDEYEFDPDAATDTAQLVQLVWGGGLVPDRVVWALDLDPARTALPVADLATRSYARMASLAQALLRMVSAPVELVAVTDRVWSVAGEPAVPANAAGLGPLRTAPRENVAVRSRQVDIDGRMPADRLALAIVAELGAGDVVVPGIVAGIERVALRGHRRWVHAWADTPNVAAGNHRGLLRENGVYLITGGLGGIALAVAEDLARTLHARVALVSRDGLPPRDEWDELLASPQTPPRLRERITGVRRVEAAGAEVLLLAADVTDLDAMRAAAARTVDRFGAVHGVLHTAGSPGGQLLAVHSLEAAETVLAPKIAGTMVIDQLMRDGALPGAELIVLFSSIVAVSADYGHTDYVAANMFLDAYAASRADTEPTVVSMNWWGWRDVGMVSAVGASDSFRALQNLRAEHKAVAVDHPLLDTVVRADAGDVEFSTTFLPDGHWVLTDHRINGLGVLPATSLLEMVRAAGHELLGPDRPLTIADVIFLDAVVVTEPVIARLKLTPTGTDGWDFDIAFGTGTADMRVQCRGRLAGGAAPRPPDVDLNSCRASLTAHGRAERHTGLVECGPRFRVLGDYWSDGRRGVLNLALEEPARSDAASYWLHPGLVDRAVYGVSASGLSHLPFSYRSVAVYRPIPSECVVVQTHRSDPGRPEFVEIDETFVDPGGAVCAVVQGYSLRAVDIAAATAVRPPADGRAVRPAAGPAPVRSHSMLSTAEGQELFRRVLAARPGPQVIVAVGSLHETLEEVSAFTHESVIATRAEDGVSRTGRTIATEFVAPQTDVQQILATLWGEALGVTEIGIDDDFFLLGGSSLTAVQLISRVRERLATDLSVADLFEYATIRRLAAVTEEHLDAMLSTLSEEDIQRALAAGGTA